MYLLLCPTADRLAEVGIVRHPGPPAWNFDTHERADRVRAAIANSGFSSPSAEIASILPCEAGDSYAFDLPLALAVILSDPAHAHLRRDTWVAWGALRLDGTTAPVEEPIVNDLGPGPYVGRVWDPIDRIPEPDDDAVISLVSVADLNQAWDVITFFAGAEQAILNGAAHASSPP